MLKSISKTDDGPIVLLGLTYENLARLKAGQPIDLPLQAMLDLFGGADGLGEAPLRTTRLVLFAGESEEAMALDLEAQGVAPRGTVRAAQEAVANRDERVTTRPWRRP